MQFRKLPHSVDKNKKPHVQLVNMRPENVFKFETILQLHCNEHWAY